MRAAASAKTTNGEASRWAIGLGWQEVVHNLARRNFPDADVRIKPGCEVAIGAGLSVQLEPDAEVREPEGWTVWEMKGTKYSTRARATRKGEVDRRKMLSDMGVVGRAATANRLFGVLRTIFLK